MKDTITIIAAILIICLVADGLRRAYISRNGKIRVSPNLRKRMRKLGEAKDDDGAVDLSHEFPNGGARVVSKREARSQESQQSTLNLRDAVPILMDEVGSARERIEPTFAASQPASQYQNEALDYSAADYAVDEREADEDEHDPLFSKRKSETQIDTTRREQVAPADDELLDQEFADERDPYDRNYDGEYPDDDYDRDDYERDEYDRDDIEERDDRDAHDDDYLEDDYPDETPATNAGAARHEVRQSEPEEVLVINVMASGNNVIEGATLLDAVLRCGMRFGDMDIFHRYSDSKGEGALLFSMVNMVKPGVFDLDTMDEFSTPGVCLFMTLPLNADSMQSFELMVNTAHTIAEQVGGELKDENRSAMTRQTIEHCRQRILDFERRRLFQRKR